MIARNASMIVLGLCLATMTACSDLPEPLTVTKSTIIDKAGIKSPEEIKGAFARLIANALSTDPDLKTKVADLAQAEEMDSDEGHAPIDMSWTIYDGGLSDKTKYETKMRVFLSMAEAVSAREDKTFDSIQSILNQRKAGDLMTESVKERDQAVEVRTHVKGNKKTKDLAARLADDHLDEVDAGIIKSQLAKTYSEADLERDVGSPEFTGEIPDISSALPATLDEAIARAKESNPEVVSLRAGLVVLRATRETAVVEATEPQIAIGINPVMMAEMVQMFGASALFLDLNAGSGVHFDGVGLRDKVFAIDGEIVKQEAKIAKAESSAVAQIKKDWATRLADISLAKNAQWRVSSDASVMPDTSLSTAPILDRLTLLADHRQASLQAIEAKYSSMESTFRLARDLGILTEAIGVSKTSKAVETVRQQLSALEKQSENEKQPEKSPS